MASLKNGQPLFSCLPFLEVGLRQGLHAATDGLMDGGTWDERKEEPLVLGRLVSAVCQLPAPCYQHLKAFQPRGDLCVAQSSLEGKSWNTASSVGQG